MTTRLRSLSFAGLAGVLTLAACASGADSSLDAKTAKQADATQAQAKAATYPVLESAPTTAPSAVGAPAEAPASRYASQDAPQDAKSGGPAGPAASAPRAEPTRRSGGPRVSAPSPAEDPRTAPVTPEPPPQPRREQPYARPVAMIAAGTTLNATIDDEITTERAHEGDRFQAELADDVLGPRGEVLLHAGSIVNGRVAASHESTGPQDRASLTLEVESITADGRTLGLAADVVDVQMDASTRDSNQTSAAKVTAGAAAGALIGRILGGSGKDAAKGAVAGAAAGAAAAYVTRSGHAVVKPGAVMKVRLTDRLVVEQP